MAQIAIERKPAIPWWAWLLIALLLIGIIWWIAAAAGDERAEGVGEPAGEAARLGEPGGPLTEIGPISGATGAGELVGRRVELSEPVRVLSVTGDRVLWVGEGAGNQTMVVAPPGAPNVVPGQTVRVFGDVRAAPPFEEASRSWNLGQDLRPEYQRQAVYINADQIEVIGGPTGEAARAGDGALTSIGTLFSATDAAGVADREVRLTEPVRVVSVTGDRVFWVGEGPERQMMVVLDQVPTPGQPSVEGRYDVNPGQMVRIFGHVRTTPSFDQASRDWNIGRNLRSEYEKRPVYIHADRLEITSRP